MKSSNRTILIAGMGNLPGGADGDGKLRDGNLKGIWYV